MKRQHELTLEEILLGQLYHWVHQRAEYLRQQKKAAAATTTDQTGTTATGDIEAELIQQSRDTTMIANLKMKEGNSYPKREVDGSENG